MKLKVAISMSTLFTSHTTRLPVFIHTGTHRFFQSICALSDITAVLPPDTEIYSTYLLIRYHMFWFRPMPLDFPCPSHRIRQAISSYNGKSNLKQPVAYRQASLRLRDLCEILAGGSTGYSWNFVYFQSWILPVFSRSKKDISQFG